MLKELNKPKEYRLEVGGIKFCTTPSFISTVLGSCVAVTMRDKKKGYAGMIHYLLPECRTMNTKPLNFGNTAIKILLNKFHCAGCVSSDLEAKIFGGADQYKLFDIGEKNIIIAKKILLEHNITVKVAQTGGHLGRKIIFNTATGMVQLKVLSSILIDKNFK